jgi:Undecaprenyl-phosphate glucose phosphotransferase
MQNNVETNAREAPTEVIDPSALPSCRPAVACLSRWLLVAALQAAEALVVATSSFIWLNDIITEGGGRAGLYELLRFALAVALVVHFALRSLGAYDFAGILNVWRSSTTAAAAWMFSTTPVLLCSIKLEPLDGLWQKSFMDWLTGGAFIMIVRLGAGYSGAVLLLARRLNHNVAIVGTGSEAQCCARLLQSDRSGANVVGFLELENDCTNHPSVEWHANFIARLQQLIQLHQVKDVIVATSERDRVQLPDLVRGLLCLPVCVLLWPQSIGVEAEWIASSKCKVGEIRLLPASAPPLDGWHWVIKDVQDRLLAFLLLTICSPVLLTIAVAIRLSNPGPVLFRQEREGYNGNRFVMFKFRTMYASPLETDRLILTAKHDPRIFPLGAFLRKTSLDELPQLLNVLRGDMWLVGPRPHSPLATAAGQRYSVAVKEYMARFRVKPGITGWAQVNGWRGATNTIEQIQQRVIYDLYYIEHWSVWFDFQILLQTAIKGLVDENAY